MPCHAIVVRLVKCHPCHAWAGLEEKDCNTVAQVPGRSTQYPAPMLSRLQTVRYNITMVTLAGVAQSVVRSKEVTSRSDFLATGSERVVAVQDVRLARRCGCWSPMKKINVMICGACCMHAMEARISDDAASSSSSTAAIAGHC